MDIIRKNTIIGLFIFSCLVGIVETYINYYPSKLLIIYWGLCAITIFLFILSKLYLEKIGKKQTISLLFVLSILVAGWLIVQQNLRLGGFLATTGCFLYSGTVLSKSKSKGWRFIFILAYLIVAFNIVSVLFFMAQDSIISRQVIGVLFISNPTESKEFLSANASVWHLVVLTLFFVASYFLFSRRGENRIPLKSTHLKLLFIVSFLASTLAGSLSALAVEYFTYRSDRAKLKSLVEARAKGKVSHQFSIHTEKDQATKVVVVIGESLNRNYMSMYGYHFNTTPNLLKLVNDTNTLTNGKLFAFNRVISPEVQTISALMSVLTNSSNQKPVPFEESVSVVDVFNKAGYESFWISNQAPLGKWDTPVAVMASTANRVFFTSSKHGLKKKNSRLIGHFDSDAVDEFDNTISKSDINKKQIYFIHLQGSHVDYVERYPEEFDVFKSRDSLLRDQYLNTVLYNDYIMNSIIQTAKKNKVDVVYYFSDHGETIGSMHNPANYKRGMSIIPYMIYLSPEYIQSHPALVQALKKNKSTPAISDNFFNDIQEVTGVKSSLYKPEASFFNDAYIIKKRRVLNNSIPFD